MTDKKPRKKKLTARITHLELNARPNRSFMLPSKPRCILINAENMPVHFYRYLYEQVGKAHHWYERRVMSDEKLIKIINAKTTEIALLLADGCPAGFYELDTSHLPSHVVLTYFGLIKDYQGLGLGKWLLNSSIQQAFDHEPQKITVQTNSLDHPAALGVYQKLGFEPVAVSEETVSFWE